MTKICKAEKVESGIITGHFVILRDKAGFPIGALEVQRTDDPEGIADQVVAALNAQAPCDIPEMTDEEWEEHARRAV